MRLAQELVTPEAKPLPPFTGEHVFEYIPDWMGGQENPNGKQVRYICQSIYCVLVLLAVYLIARWHSKHFKKF